MSDKELFLKFLDLHKGISANEQLIRKGGLDIAEFTDDYYSLATLMMKIAFSKEQVDWIEWWLYEDVDKIAYHTKPKKKNYILKTPEQFWDYLQNHCEKKKPI